MLEHGGGLRIAARTYGIPLEAWLDLSTGINPRSWPIPEIPATVWNRLPENDDGLEEAAQAYYGCGGLLPLAGSQAAIQGIPRLRPPGRVGILSPTYAEHGRGWREAGHAVEELTDGAVTQRLPVLDALVVVNPNNPTGRLLPPATLLTWHGELVRHGGWLVVDEAFMDADPTHSLAGETGRPGLLVLRSLGKFFGLAGARGGFLLAEAGILSALGEWLGPWSVPAPTRWVARRALTDHAWIARTRLRLQEESARLAELLRQGGLPPAGGTALFQWVLHPEARRLQEALGRRGILVRAFDAPASLRFGLPGKDGDWSRLEKALGEISTGMIH